MAVTRFRFRRDPAAEWTAANPVLAEGEPGFERDTKRMKVGDGVTAWRDLPYVAPSDAELTATIADQTSPVVNPDGLNKWRVALSKRRTTPVRVLVSGNSNWEGTGAADYADRFQRVLQDRLRVKYQPAAVPGAPIANIHLAGMSPIPTSVPYSFTGTVSGSQYGLGGRGFKLLDGSSVTVTWNGDRLKINRLKAGSVGKINIVLDGGAAIVIDDWQGTGESIATWDSGPLTRGSHTVVITRDVTSAAGRDVYIADIEPFDGDYASGVRVYDNARHGAAVNTFAASQTGWKNALLAYGGWSVLVMGWGENDTALSPADYKTALLSVIAFHRTWGFNSSVLLVHGPLPGGYNAANWEAFGQVEREIAETDPDVSWLDLTKNIPAYDAGGNALGVYADTKHKNAAGQAWQADVIAEVLSTR